MGHWTPEQRKEVAESDDMADLRTAEFGLTAPGGHPSELHGPRGGKGHGGPPPGAGSGSKPPEHGHRHGFEAPNATNPEEAIKFVAARIADGAYYIKIMIEEGTVLKAPGLPMLTNDTLLTAVREAHSHGKTGHRSHPHCRCYRASHCSRHGRPRARLPRPASHTRPHHHHRQLRHLRNPVSGPQLFHHGARSLRLRLRRPGIKQAKPRLDVHIILQLQCFPEGNFPCVLATVAALHKAGVDILVGTDASVPQPHLGGLTHGASVHHEM